jgi:transposase
LEVAWARHFESLKKLKCGEIRLDEVVEPPRFKKKNTARQSFRYPDPKQFRIEQGNNRLFLPKLGWVRYRNSRALEGQPSNLTVSREGHKWFVSVQTEREVKQPVHPSSSIVGIDLGVVRFATLSNGEVIPPAHSFERKEKRLKRYQHRMARRTGAPSPTAKYEPPVSGLWTYLRRKPHDTSRLPVCAVRLHGRRGFRGSYQYSISRSLALE